MSIVTGLKSGNPHQCVYCLSPENATEAVCVLGTPNWVRVPMCYAHAIVARNQLNDAIARVDKGKSSEDGELKYDCPLCGREYDDATQAEIDRWTADGFCCDDCIEDQQPEVSFALLLTLSAAETVAAIMLSIGRDERWNEWYDSDKWDGIIGFYQYVSHVAVTLDTWFENANLVWGDEIDWYLTCDKLVEGIFNDEHISKFTIADYVYFFQHKAPIQVDAPQLSQLDQLCAELADFAVQDELPDTIRALLL